jgi:hypothetical protein
MHDLLRMVARLKYGWVDEAFHALMS